MLIAGCIGTDVKSAFTSYDMIHSYGFNWMPSMLLMKSLGVLDMVWGYSYQGFQDPGKFFGCLIGYRPSAGNDGS